MNACIQVSESSLRDLVDLHVLLKTSIEFAEDEFSVDPKAALMSVLYSVLLKRIKTSKTQIRPSNGSTRGMLARAQTSRLHFSEWVILVSVRLASSAS